MISELFSFGSFAVSPFGITLVLAFVSAYFQLRWGMTRLGVGTEDDASAITLAAGVGGILGSKVYYAILYGDPMLVFSRSGLVWYGGFLLATVLILAVVRQRRLPAWPMIDAAAPALAVGYGVGRIGCFLVGDDYGVPTQLPWGVSFPVGLPATTAGNLERYYGIEVPGAAAGDLVAVHPTQIYETLLAFTIWWLGRRWLRQREAGTRGVGMVAIPVLALLAMERFAVEFFRAKDDRFFGETFTLAQLISVGILIALWLLRRRRMQTLRAAAG